MRKTSLDCVYELAKKDNAFKYDVLKNFSDIIGFNLDDVLSKITSLQKLY